jgi:hypothetical protein
MESEKYETTGMKPVLIERCDVKNIRYIITCIQLERKGVVVKEVLPTLFSEEKEEEHDDDENLLNEWIFKFILFT